MKLTQIYEGWKNHLLPEKKLKKIIQQTANYRLSVCNGCEHLSSNKKGYESYRPDVHCTDCGCTISAKTKCLSCECPLKKWEAMMTKEQEEEIDNA